MNFVRLWTLTKKECHRFLKVWVQTVMSPVIIALLYFAVFGAALSSRIDEFSGIPYLAFIIPSLALLQATVNAFQNPSSSIIISEYHGTISDLLVSPLSGLEKTIGYFLGGVARGMLVTLVVFFVAFFFVDDFLPKHPFWLLCMCFLANAIFSLMGTLVGIWGKTFDQISGVTTFIITPMAFLGGVFYSIDVLPSLAQKLTLLNPFFYFVDGSRWAFFGVSDFNPLFSFVISGVLFIILFLLTWWAFRKDWRMKK